MLCQFLVQLFLRNMVQFSGIGKIKCPMNILILLLNLHITTFAIQLENEKNYATSVARMENLLLVEKMMLKQMLRITNTYELKLNFTRRNLIDMRLENFKARKDPEAYTGNPLKGFALMRRLYADWKNWIKLIKRPIGLKYIDAMLDERPNMPTSNDFFDAVLGIYRIQKLYDLNAEDIARGLINGKQYDTNLTAIDSFYIANALMILKNFNGSLLWLQTAIHSRFDNKLAKTVFGFNMTDLYNMRNSLMITNETVLLENENDFPLKLKNCCRGFLKKKINKLHCLYNRTTNDFLKMAPIKMEELSMDPYIVMFHDILYDNEIKELIKLSKPTLKLTNMKWEANFTSLQKYRIASSSWLDQTDDDIVKRIYTKTVDMSGFDEEGFEFPEVINYGIGGYYTLHHDFLLDGSFDDRIATVMFYLTDVELGGATIFPDIDLTVFPRKGSALLWYNLKSNGMPDNKTLHMACPVAIGSKWIISVWIHERAQFRARPCYD